MKKLINYVDPFIGVDGWGSCLCGPYLPNSLVRLGPDTTTPHPPNGYESSKPIIRFSHTHTSGSGGGGRYGNVGVLPFTGSLQICRPEYEREDEQAAAGYYAVTLKPAGIRAELTTTHRTGLHRYTFPAGSSTGISAGSQANLIVDAGAVIQTPWEVPGIFTGLSIGGYIEKVSEKELAGRGDFRGGWGHTFPYSVYFYLRFDKPIQQVLLSNSQGDTSEVCIDGSNCIAALGFGQENAVQATVGISYVSVAKARASVDREVGDASFEHIRTKAEEIWEESLSRIRVEGGTEDQTKLFYSLFNRMICMPGDLGIDDENPLWQSGVRHYTDFYCLWDSVRNVNSLYSLIDPELEVNLLNCLLDIADHTGWLPDAWIVGHSAQIQGGSSSDILFCEAALKGLKGIDYEKALKQMRKNNETESPNPFLYGRFLTHYRDLGYVSTDVEKSCVSRHLEYAYQDWCIGKLAGTLGYTEIAEAYCQNSQKVWNLWREDLKCFAPKNPDGTWVDPFDPYDYANRAERWNDPYFYEGYSVQWSFNVQHGFKGLVERHGGNEAFVKHVDEFFEKGHYDSKETMLHIPYLYIFAGRPDKTADRVRECMEKNFRPARDGLVDNEDAGCQSAFYICSAMGIYPIMGQDIYLLTTPVFTKTEICLGKTGKKLVIEAPEAGKGKNYITAARLNGKPLNRAWIRHGEIAEGAVLTFELSDRIGDWGRTELP